MVRRREIHASAEFSRLSKGCNGENFSRDTSPSIARFNLIGFKFNLFSIVRPGTELRQKVEILFFGIQVRNDGKCFRFWSYAIFNNNSFK